MPLQRGDLGAPQDAPACGLYDAQDDKAQQQQRPQVEQQQHAEQERQDEREKDQASFSPGDASSQKGRFPDCRRRRSVATHHPPSAEDSDFPAKRKRTPSRRVVEAAESALLLEEVIAGEDSAPAAPARTQLSVGPYGGFQDSYRHTLSQPWRPRVAATASGGEVSARVAALRDALHVPSGQCSALDSRLGPQHFWRNSGAEDPFASGILGPPDFQKPSVESPPNDAAKLEIPPCRRSRK